MQSSDLSPDRGIGLLPTLYVPRPPFSRISAAFRPFPDEGIPRMNAVNRDVVRPADGVPLTSPRRTLADAIAAVACLGSRSEARRRDMVSSLRAVAKIIGKPPEAIALDPQALSAAVTGKPARCYGLEPKRYQNVVADLRGTLRALGISAPKPGSRTLGGAWGSVLAALPVQWERFRLSRFAHYCAARAIAPAAVMAETVEQFIVHESATEIASDVRDRAARAVKIWNRLATARPDLNLRPLPWRRQSREYRRRAEEFPASFQADLAAWRRQVSQDSPAALFEDLAHPDPTAPSRPSRPMKTSSVALRHSQILGAATALVASGRDPASIRSLRDLVTPFAHVRAIAEFHYARRQGEATSNLFGTLEILRQIAQHHCRLAPHELQPIVELRNRVRPRQQGIVSRNRERLRHLEDPRHRAALLHLPGELLRQAEAATQAPRRTRLALAAAAIEILLVCPLRLDNLRTLRLDANLRRATGRRQPITHILVPDLSTKNGVAIEWPVPPASLPVLDAWITRFRREIAAADCPWLFPGMFDGPRHVSSLRTIIAAEIARVVGIEVHPHLFRHFAAALFLRRYPGQYEAVRRVLGHKRLETTVTAYMPTETDAAARRFDEVVLKERAASRTLARQVFRKRRSRRGGGT
jgi:integrase